MPEPLEQKLAFLVCPACSGRGRLKGHICSPCQGSGLVLWHQDSLLWWGKRLDSLALIQEKIQKAVKTVLNSLLLILGILGFLSLAWLIWQRGWEEPADLKFWLIPDWRVLVFWLSIITDMYFYYRLERESRSQIKVKKKTYEEFETTKVKVPTVWEEIEILDKKFWVDVSQAFTNEALFTLKKAWEIAKRLGHQEVEPIHLLASLVGSSQVNVVFGRLGISSKVMVEKIKGVLSARKLFKRPEMILSLALKKILLESYIEAFKTKKERIEDMTLLLVLVERDEIINQIFYDLEVDLIKLKNVASWLGVQEELRKNWQRFKGKARLKPKSAMDRAMTAVTTPTLDRFSQDLTLLAKFGYLTPCMGREKEIERIFRIIESGRKSVILVGNPGVGKGAIIEGIAQRMVTEEVPKILQDKRLISLSVAKLVSGASPSEAEGRLLNIIHEIMRAGNIILVINGLQDMIGITVGSEESLDLSEVLVGPLSEGYILSLMTSNPRDYARYIENVAIGEVLQKVTIEEPGLNETILILEAKAPFIEARNRVYFSYAALEQAARLSQRYIHERYLPEKAIQVIEEVAVYTRKTKGQGAIIDAQDVAYIISEKTKIPVTKVTEEESKKLLQLEERIHKRIVDQEEAVKIVARSLRRARAELREVKRPIANLLFLGPTGVGKTELAKTVAEVYFGSEEQMIRLDMSEYQEKTSINRLIGAPAGTSLGHLTEQVRKNPFSLLLLDEIEKAHPDILNIFLAVMDDGRLTDAQARTIDFTNVILIGTSNAGTSFIQDEIKKKTPLEEIKNQLINQELKPYFRPEFLNRFDGIIVFKPLSIEDVEKITKLMLAKVAQRLEVKGIGLEYTPEAVSYLAETGFDLIFGARPLRRVIQEQVDDALANLILEGKLDRRDTVILEDQAQLKVIKVDRI